MAAEQPPGRRVVRRQDRAASRRTAASRSASPSRRMCRARDRPRPLRLRRARATSPGRDEGAAPRSCNERFRAAGVTHVTLDADLSNRDGARRLAQARLRRLGAPAGDADSTRSRRGSAGDAAGPDFGSIHVQSDDEAARRRRRAQVRPAARPLRRLGDLAAAERLDRRLRRPRRPRPRRAPPSLAGALDRARRARLHDLARGRRGRALPARRARQRRRRVPLGAGALRRGCRRATWSRSARTRPRSRG